MTPCILHVHQWSFHTLIKVAIRADDNPYQHLLVVTALHFVDGKIEANYSNHKGWQEMGERKLIFDSTVKLCDNCRFALEIIPFHRRILSLFNPHFNYHNRTSFIQLINVVKSWQNSNDVQRLRNARTDQRRNESIVILLPLERNAFRLSIKFDIKQFRFCTLFLLLSASTRER